MFASGGEKDVRAMKSFRSIARFGRTECEPGACDVWPTIGQARDSVKPGRLQWLGTQVFLSLCRSGSGVLAWPTLGRLISIRGQIPSSALTDSRDPAIVRQMPLSTDPSDDRTAALVVVFGFSVGLGVGTLAVPSGAARLRQIVGCGRSRQRHGDHARTSHGQSRGRVA